MKESKKKYIWIGIILILFFVGAISGYLYFFNIFKDENTRIKQTVGIYTAPEDVLTLRMYYPGDRKLTLEMRNIPRRSSQLSLIEATVEEFFKKAVESKDTVIPKNVKVLGIYKGIDGIIYIDFSDDLRRNFQGDALDEFLLLKGLYESIVSNVDDVKDVKITIEGKEVETIGGHFYCLYPLKETFSIDIE